MIFKANLIQPHFETMSEAEAHLTAFLNKKRKVRQEKDKRIKQKPILVELELNKFEYVYQEIIGMLGQSETFAKPLNS